VFKRGNTPLLLFPLSFEERGIKGARQTRNVDSL